MKPRGFLNTLKTAEQSHIRAMGLLGNLYLKKIAFQRKEDDLRSGFYWTERAVKEGSPGDTDYDLTVHTLGQYYLYGLSPETGEDRCKLAFHWIKYSLELQNATPLGPAPICLFNLGLCYAEAIGCEDNLENKILATTYLEKSFELGFPDARTGCGLCWLRLGMIYIVAKDCADTYANKELAIGCFKKALEYGCLDSLEKLGICYWEALGCEETTENLELAVAYFRRSAIEAKSAHGMFMLGMCLLKAMGCKDNEENKREGVYWLQEAIKLGSRDSMGELGYCYEYSRGIKADPKNIELAFYWYTEAAKLDSLVGMANLGHCYMSSIGCEDTEDNKNLAIYWLKRAIEMGDVLESKANLGYLYFIGMKGVKRDLNQALPLFEQIKGKYPIHHLIAYIYFIQKNYSKALENYIEARLNGVQVSDRLIAYLAGKLQKKKSSFMPEDNKTGKSGKVKAEKQKEDLMKSQASVEKLYEEICSKLREIQADPTGHEGCDFDAGVSLTQIAQLHASFMGNKFKAETNLVTKKKILMSFETLLNGYEEKVNLAEAHKKAKDGVEELRRSVSTKPPSSSFKYAEEVSRADLLSESRALKVAAAQKLAQAGRKADIKVARPPENPNYVPAVVRVLQPTEIAPEDGPYSHADADYNRTNAQNIKTWETKVNQILDEIRVTKYGAGKLAMKDVIHRLKTMGGGYKFKKVTAAYARIPGADVVWQMKLDDQFRVLIPFERVQRDVLPAQNVINNNNNPAAVSTVEFYQLYGKGKIFIIDPHKG